MSFTSAEIEAVALSLKVAILCSLISLPFAIAFGWVLARKKFIGKIILDNLIQLPLVMPPVTIGYLLLAFLGSNGLVGKYLYNLFDIRIAFTFTAALLAAMVVSFPLVVRAVKVAFEMVDESLEEAVIKNTRSVPEAVNGKLPGPGDVFAMHAPQRYGQQQNRGGSCCPRCPEQ